MRHLIDKLTGGRLVGQRLAVGLAPGELHLALATRNGGLRLEHAAEVEVRTAALQPGLRSPNVLEPDALDDALGSALEAMRRGGASVGRQRLVSLVVPDAAVRMTTVPLEGGAPRSAEGRAMAAWALRDLLPFPVAGARVDWAAFGPRVGTNGDDVGNRVDGGAQGEAASRGSRGGRRGGGTALDRPSRGAHGRSSGAAAANQAGRELGESGDVPPRRGWLLAIGADPAVVREYEAVPAGAVAGAVGRVVPWTLAAAAGADLDAGGGAFAGEAKAREAAGSREAAAAGEGAAPGEAAAPGETITPGDGGASGASRPSGARPRLVLCGVGGLMACLIEEDGVPRFHRAWRGRLAATEVRREIDSLAAYVRGKLELRGGEAAGIVEACVCGPEEWAAVAGDACETHGWPVRRLPVAQALLGSLKR